MHADVIITKWNKMRRNKVNGWDDDSFEELMKWYEMEWRRGDRIRESDQFRLTASALDGIDDMIYNIHISCIYKLNLRWKVENKEEEEE